MADAKISALTNLTAADAINDMIPIVDVSDTPPASGNTKRISINNILSSSPTASGALTVTGLVTAGSATITGDLAVDTSTLKVDSTNNRVGINTSSPANALDVFGGNIRLVGGNIFQILNSVNDSNVDISNNGGSGVASMLFKVAGSSAMTLNSTGLGVGGSPTAKLTILAGADGDVGFFRGGSTRQLQLGTSATAGYLNVDNASAGFELRVNGTARVYTDVAGNVGVGGSPSASKVEVYSSNTGTSGLAEANALKVENNNATVGNAAGLFLSQSGNAGCGVAAIATNRTGGSRASALALYYYNQATSASPIEGARLDASGNLLVGTTAANGIKLASYVTTAGGPASSGTSQSAGSLRIGAASTAGVMDMGTAGSYSWIQATNASNLATNYNVVINPNGGELLLGTTNASVGTAAGLRTGDGGGRLELGSANSTNSNIGFDMYSTGAAAYRFYVGYGGTVFATNTTISAISDARLKENVQDIDVGLGAILALKPRKFDWKAGKGKDIKGDRGFIAQEFEQVFPQLVDEWKDNAPEGEAPYKSVRQDLIPVLVKAIQELAAEVNALKNA
jgi:hypothetical protein